MATLYRKKKSGKGKISKSTALGEAHAKVMAKTPPGEGGRFKSLKSKLAKKGGVKTPGALTAWIGRQKYGKAKFQKMAASGK